MAHDGDWDLAEPPTAAAAVSVRQTAPRAAYLEALRRYDGALLARIVRCHGVDHLPAGRGPLAEAITERLEEACAIQGLVATLERGEQLALCLFSLTESTCLPAHALGHALGCLGVEARGAVWGLLELGLLAVAPEGGPIVRKFDRSLDVREGQRDMLLAHPAAVSATRTVLPEGPSLPVCRRVRQTRETDGLEPIVRLAAVWQRVADAPLRQTRQGTIYKRDRDRIEDDPVIAGPIADALEPFPDLPAFWLGLAQGVGLLAVDAGSDRIVATPPEFWTENAYHLPQMLAAFWLRMNNWDERGGIQRENAVCELSLPYTRAPILLWLATLGDQEWVAIKEVEARLSCLLPGWDRATFIGAPAIESPMRSAARSRDGKSRASGGRAVEPTGPSTLEAMLLGPAYQLGLLRAAEEVPGGRRVVQLSSLGRYVLRLGPPPHVPLPCERFLFVQPSFEVIAYRQGMTSGLVGQLSRFAHWAQVGAAMALRLTPESVYRGLEGGMTPQEMLELLARHSQRPLPAGVAESVRTWANRRERVTYFASATLLEFAAPGDLEQALNHWPSGEDAAPVRISGRLLLVEGDSAIPFRQFRMTGARDYRRPPEACVDVEHDGVNLTLDLARSDLLVDAELERFADEQPSTRASDGPASANPRRFVVSGRSLARAAESGLTPTQLSQWFRKRTGQDTPASVRLLLASGSMRVPPLQTTRQLILHTPSADLLDGLAQHPETGGLLGDRLGATSVVIPDASLERFRQALRRLGLSLIEPPSTGAAGGDRG
jgi:hypothetical protein